MSDKSATPPEYDQPPLADDLQESDEDSPNQLFPQLNQKPSPFKFKQKRIRKGLNEFEEFQQKLDYDDDEFFRGEKRFSVAHLRGSFMDCVLGEVSMQSLLEK